MGGEVHVHHFHDAGATPGQVLVRAGVNGKIDTAPGGDDYTRAKHAILCSTDPLNQDTDYDGIPDGREVLIGTNPNSQDAGKVTDSDNDGLYDSEEDAGWDVTVVDADGNSTTRHVTSNKYRADTDLDNLPDIYESALRSDPRASDTDGDTLFDRDEFDPEDTDHYYNASALQIASIRCAASGSCQAPPVPDLANRLRTSVLKVDSDGDGRADNVEVVMPWTVSVYGVDSYEIRSKPYEADSDKDGWNDLAEATNGTDPEKADTDGDGSKDKYEKVTRGTNPLRPDKKVTFYYTGFTVQDDCEGTGEDDGADLYGALKIQDPSGTTTELIELDDWGNDKTAVNFLPINPKTFIMYPGQSFTLLSEQIKEYDSASADEVVGSFTETVDYNSVTDGKTETLNPAGGNDTCAITIFGHIDAPLGP